MKKRFWFLLILISWYYMLEGLNGFNFERGKISGELIGLKIVGGKIEIMNNDSLVNYIKNNTRLDTILPNKPIGINLIFETQWTDPNRSENEIGNYFTLITPALAMPAPVPTQTIKKIRIISRFKLGNEIYPNDTINKFFKFTFLDYNNKIIEILDLSTLNDEYIGDYPVLLLFTPPQPITEETPFQIDVLMSLSNCSEVRLTSKMVYLKN